MKADTTKVNGTGTKMLVRRVWVGRPLTELVDRQRAVYQSVSANSRPFADDQTIASSDPTEVAERIAGTMAQTGVDAINLRVHLPGIDGPTVRAQIEVLGGDVVPRLRKLVAAPEAPSKR